MVRFQKYFSALAALLCGLSVAMSAYGSHALEGESQRRLLMASYFAFAHGLSLIVLVRRSSAISNILACCLMFLGLAIFSGSLAFAALWQAPTTFAPAGGFALILAWCWIALNFLRPKENL